MEYKGFILDKNEGIAILTFNRPERMNALTVEIGNVLLPKLFRDLQDDDAVRVLIITGTGKGFCAGADIDELPYMSQLAAKLTRAGRLQAIGAYTLSLYNLEKPVIAAVNGVAAGAGVSLALIADIRIASENARFSMSFVDKGLVPDCGATFTLPRLIGLSRAFELMYGGGVVDAQEAERIGLVNRVVPHDKLIEETVALAKRLAKAPPLALAQTKRALHYGIMNSLEQQLYFETYAQNFCSETEDAREGINSFLEKREPQFKGR